ncbi:MAG: ATP-dependent sacrificial sulfur transferase LarE [Candidatus Bathyarchaeia archaeon]
MDVEAIEGKISELEEMLEELESVVVAFSGGVDSSVIAALAYKALGTRAIALTIDSPLLPGDELEGASAVARHIGINHDVIKLNELNIKEFKSNPENRCYVCKKNRYNTLKKFAEDRGYNAVLEGTNVSDLEQYRPGIRASREIGVLAPLIKIGLDKKDTRGVARYLDLPNADKPSNSCLASRIPYNQEITAGRLSRISNAEKIVKELTEVKTIRVRDHGDLARIEVGADERSRLYGEGVMDEISDKLKNLGYRFVAMDLEGYRFGSYDSELEDG